MGTNYYAVKIEPTVRDDRVIHIGKASFGWRFAFHEYSDTLECGDIDVHSFQDWEQWLQCHIGKDYVLRDEYDDSVDLTKLFEMIELKQKDGLTAEAYRMDPKHTDEQKQSSKRFRFDEDSIERLVDGYRFIDRAFC